MGHHIKTVFELINTVFIFYNELSPSGKATDFDSVIPWVRIPPAQPKPLKVEPIKVRLLFVCFAHQKLT